MNDLNVRFRNGSGPDPETMLLVSSVARRFAEFEREAGLSNGVAFESDSSPSFFVYLTKTRRLVVVVDGES
jgi:hypothetical protein